MKPWLAFPSKDPNLSAKRWAGPAALNSGPFRFVSPKRTNMHAWRAFREAAEPPGKSRFLVNALRDKSHFNEPRAYHRVIGSRK